MRTVRLLLLIAQPALLALLAYGLLSSTWPLGVPGEWEWLRLARGPAAIDVTLAALAVLAYASIAAMGLRFLRSGATPGREGLAVAGLMVAAMAVQSVVPSGAPEGYGLAKWSLVLHSPASTGYYSVAKREIRDAKRFLADYPDWIRRQDALHVGTHPPGLFLVEHSFLRFFGAHPRAARWWVERLPGSVQAGFRAINDYDPLPIADRATLGLTGALTLLACAGTVVPLYLLSRATSSATAAWSSAVLWPLVPATILFQPLADTAFPLLSVTAIALAAHSARPASSSSRGLALAASTGVVLAIGMFFTLAFLAVGLIVGLVLVTSPGVENRRRMGLLVATGAGFMATTLLFWSATGANPFVIAWWNQENHARFYVEFRRTYRAWLLVNPVELALALGIPASAWALVGLASPRSVPRAAWATLAVLIILTLSGRNLGEVARLWIPFMPPLLVASGHGLTRLGGGPGALAVTAALMGAETLLLQATIQVVYPV